jgi:hypothetical protein
LSSIFRYTGCIGAGRKVVPSIAPGDAFFAAATRKKKNAETLSRSDG